MKKYLIGIDIGTSGAKTLLFDLEGNAVASHLTEYPMYQPQNGYAEQNPDDWAKAAIEGIKAVTEGVDKTCVMGIGLSGQMHGLVMLDENKSVLRKSIIWCDQRTEQQVEYITQKIGREKLIEITANPAVAGFTASKICWVQQHERVLWDKCRHILLPKDYVRFVLTGKFATDVSDASGTGLLDVPNRKFSNHICRRLEIPLEYLPQLFESDEVTGSLTEEISFVTGLPQSTVVVGGAGDQAAAAIGNGIVCEGRASDTLGTSGVVFAHTDTPLIDPLGRVHTFCHAVRGKWHVMGVTQGCGLSMQWARNNLTEGLNYDKVNELARSVKIGSEKLIFLPYLMGERTPHLDSKCRGVFFGLSNIHEKRHLLRAVFEGISFSQLQCVEIIHRLGAAKGQIRVGGGGAKSEFWLQMLADMFGEEVATVNVAESGALGAAILAGIGAGVYGSAQQACNEIIKIKKVYLPQKDADYSKYYDVYKALYFANKDLFEQLYSIN